MIKQIFLRKKWLWAVALIVAIGIWASREAEKKKAEKKSGISIAKVEGASYWTCPMHPQIHSDKPGECPICHMNLVQVKQQAEMQTQNTLNGNRASVQPNAGQLQLLGVQKYTVEKMDLKVLLPISGRFLSANSIAFQVYESDLRYVKPGLSFKGESSFYPEEEILGAVSSVDSIVDPTSRTVRVIGSVKKGPRGLFSETSFRGAVEVDLKDRIAIPESSVLHSGAGDLVYLFGSDNRLTAKYVKLGQKTESFFEVLDGLQAGDSISSGPNFLLDSEAKLRGTQEGKP